MECDEEELKATKEKSADELFEELGYTNLKEHRSGMILHYIKSSDLSANESEHIVFYKNKTIGFYYTYCNFKKDLNMQELQAINKKCEELRLEIMGKFIKNIRK